MILNNKLLPYIAVIFLVFACSSCQTKRKTVNGREKKVVFMGDSITQGWQTVMPDFFSEKNYINKGIGGQVTAQMLERFNRDVLMERPQAVVILAGTNDIAGLGGDLPVASIFKNIVAMSTMAKDNGIKVILCSVLPAYEYSCCKSVKPVPLIAALNAKLKGYAGKERFVYVDFFSVLADQRKGLSAELTNDGVHPNKTGYELMQPIILKAIRHTLND